MKMDFCKLKLKLLAKIVLNPSKNHNPEINLNTIEKTLRSNSMNNSNQEWFVNSKETRLILKLPMNSQWWQALQTCNATKPSLTSLSSQITLIKGIRVRCRKMIHLNRFILGIILIGIVNCPLCRTSLLLSLSMQTQSTSKTIVKWKTPLETCTM